MPPARRSARSSSRRSAAFKQPPALKQLNKSLEAAQKALTQLRKQAGRDAAKTTKSLHGDLSKFVANAKRDTGKFSTAIRRDFDQAQKAAASAQRSARSQTRRGTARKSTSTARKSTSTARKSSARTGARRSTRSS
jgi:hypothetical protein